MSSWRARSHNYPVNQPVPDVLLNQFLTGIRAHKQIFSGHNHIGQPLSKSAHGLNIDYSADVCAAMTYIHSYLCHIYLLKIGKKY
jgi:hypothetical protein